MLLQVDRYSTGCSLRSILPARIIWHPGIMCPCGSMYCQHKRHARGSHGLPEPEPCCGTRTHETSLEEVQASPPGTEGVHPRPDKERAAQALRPGGDAGRPCLQAGSCALLHTYRETGGRISSACSQPRHAARG